MSKSKRPELSREQHVLDHGHPRLLSAPEDIARCDQAVDSRVLFLFNAADFHSEFE